MRKHANKFKKQLKHEENLPTVRSLWSTTHSLKDSSLVLDSAIAQRKIETWIQREREWQWSGFPAISNLYVRKRGKSEIVNKAVLKLW